ncbi:hypothetical protein IscW_ISCW019598 [Ixodes scapularis]|uniref:Uncharacterized protein n=1 Tax=Ixodes scapularis TaxID=6945 RepID=B7PWY2_IXOSC|nr:hypothetical protein IscW_ISCW019598 [Ixodes scapularis]|eukprot:XP_002410382.1 hypothetical protein IscW_ISCW019598 [Ixodes scapularis]
MESAGLGLEEARHACNPLRGLQPVSPGVDHCVKRLQRLRGLPGGRVDPDPEQDEAAAVRHGDRPVRDAAHGARANQGQALQVQRPQLRQAVHSPVGALEQPGDAGGVHGLQLLQSAHTPAAQGGGARRGHLLQPELPAPHAPGRLHQLPRRRSGTETTVWPRPYPPGIRQPAAFSVVTACNLLVLLLGMNRRLLADLPPTHNGRPAGLLPNWPRCFKVRDDRDPGIVPSLCASDCFFGTPHRHEREARLRRQRKENLQWCRPPWNSATSKRHHPVRSAPTP